MEWKGVIVYLNRKIVLFTRHFFFHDKKENHIGKYLYFIGRILFYYSNFLLPMLVKNCIFLSIIYQSIIFIVHFFVFSSIDCSLIFLRRITRYQWKLKNNFLLFQKPVFKLRILGTSDLSVIWNLKSLVVDRPCTWQLFSTFYVERPHCPSLTIVYSK